MDKCPIILTLLMLQSAMPVFADTINMKDATEKKGIVVESYHDRLVLSTVDGEMQIKMRDIKDVKYDRLEQNLTSLGDFYYQKENMTKALEYYEKAYNLNPEYKESKEKFLHLRSVLQNRPQKKIESDMDRRRSIFMKSGKVYESAGRDRSYPTVKERFMNSTGLELVSEGQMPKVEAVAADSAADKAGIIKGDLIYSIWGRLTGYLDLDKIIDMIMDSPSSEIGLVIKRKMLLSDDKDYTAIDRPGFDLEMKEDGLTVSGVEKGSMAARYGLSRADLITDIAGAQTRYMPFKEAVKLINTRAREGKIELTVLRDIVLWKGE